MHKQRGIGALDLMIIIGVLVTLGLFIYEQKAAQEGFDKVRARFPTITVADQELVSKYQAKPLPTIPLSGRYAGKTEYEGVDFSMTYLFGPGNTLTKESAIKNGKFNTGGSAKYAFDGSVLIFSDIKGDKILFPELGEPITVTSQTEFVSHGVDMSITMRSMESTHGEKRDE